MNSKQLNVGMNRGKARLWIEGRWLAEAGFAKGQNYSITCLPAENRLVIYLDGAGSRRVAGTADRPIMDLTRAAEMSAIGGAGARVVLESTQAGCIVVSQLA